jgi:hypothetical protein
MKNHAIKNLLIALLIGIAIFSFAKNRQKHINNALKVYKDQQVCDFFKRETGWIASDGALTIPLENNNVLWLFGDTFTNDYNAATGTVPCLFNVRSCGMLQPYNNWDWHQTTTLLNDKKGSLFMSNNAPGHFNWPAEGINIKDTAYVYCLSLKNVPGGMGFGAAGQNVFAKMKIPEMKVTGYHQLQDFDGINFGIGFVKNTADGYVYAYGDRAKSFMQHNLFIARFPISNPDSKWAFWDGKGWNGDVKNAASIGLIGAVSPNVAKVKNKYILLTSDFSLDCDMGKNIYVQVSNNLTGPFSTKKLLYTIADTVKGHYPFFYLAVAHPEYINPKNELLITYSINGYGKCLPPCANNQYNPDYYRPRGIRVPLKLIDPSL